MTRSLLVTIMVGAITFLLLVPAQIFPQRALFLGERLIAGGGWLQILLISLYSSFLYSKMLSRESRSVWRNRSWLIFTVLFYSQLILGLSVDSLYLLTGKLHFPIPMVIVAGPIYRFSSWFMPLLFLFTILLAGPAWCSHLCYFGAIDSWISGKSHSKRSFRERMWSYKPLIRMAVLFVVVAVALTLRLLNAPQNSVFLFVLLFFVIGLLIIATLSYRKGVMAHCTLWCPVGTLVNYLKYLSPFRFKVNSSCTSCMRCLPACKYSALNRNKDGRLVIGNGCTYCGDCLSYCRYDAFEYSYFGIKGKKAESLWIAFTVIAHSLFLAIARV